jgi:hypothetical protein
VQPAALPVQIASYTFTPSNGTLSGSIWIKNIAYVKVVQLFYSDTTPSFLPQYVFSASYSNSVANGYEVWKFSGTNKVLGAKSQVSFP